MYGNVEKIIEEIVKEGARKIKEEIEKLYKRKIEEIKEELNKKYEEVLMILKEQIEKMKMKMGEVKNCECESQRRVQKTRKILK